MVTHNIRSPRRISLLHSLLVLTLTGGVGALLTGCGAGTLDTSASGTISVTGTVHGGQGAVTGASIFLYTAGTGGNGSLAHPMLVNPRTTDGTGTFDLTGDYSCTNGTDQVYLVASQGNPGGNGNNSALILMDALGNCSNLLTPGYHISVNEITTVAAAWALAPFMTSATNVGASSTNATGLANAFLDAQMLADPESGVPPTLTASRVVESGKVLALADALAPCVNSNGSGCTTLFTAAKPLGGSSPTTTLGAALNIVKYPGQNVTAVWSCITALGSPFPTTLTKAPSDWTMSLTISPTGFYSPEAIAVDAKGNVWAAAQNNPNSTAPNGMLQAFSPQGVPYSTSGYGAGILSDSYGIDVDGNDNVWVTNWELPAHNGTYGSITRFMGVSSGTPGTPVINSSTGNDYYYDPSLDYPTSLASDASGNLFIANYANSSGSVYSNAGVLMPGLGNVASGEASFPTFLSADGSGGFWMSNSGDNTITHVSSAGAVTSHLACCSQPYGVAVDQAGNAWAANYGSNSVSEVSPNPVPVGTITIASETAGGIVSPSAVAIDAAENVWVVNYRATRTHGSISELAGNGSTLGANGTPLTAGAAISPNYVSATVPGGYGLDASLLIPNAIVPDASGNLWVSNTGYDNIVMFFGLATPTATPLIGLPKAP